MAREALLLLFLLSLGITGSQEIKNYEEHKIKEGGAVNVSCPYQPRHPEKSMKVWCKLHENRKDCSKLIIMTEHWTLIKEGKFSLHFLDESKSGHIIIMMVGLREKDSGNYMCMIFKKGKATVLKSIRLEVYPAQRTTKSMQNTPKVPFITPATCSFLEKGKFIILGVVLFFLLLMGVFIIGIVYIKKLHQKAKKGDEFYHMNNDFENKRQKSRGSTMEMDYEEGTESIQYASLTYINPRGSKCSNTQKGSSPNTVQTSFQAVEYASIKRT